MKLFLLVIAFALMIGPTTLSAQNQFSFTMGGDIGVDARADASLRAIPASGAVFHLAVGDMDYDQIATDELFCDYVKARVGQTFPFEIVTGNHEEQGGQDGYIKNHAACMPDRMGSNPLFTSLPGYPANYYFDYPQTNPLMRVIMISPALTYEGIRYDFTSSSTYYSQLSQNIDSARAANIPWVVVGMHKNCISVGTKSCEIGASLFNLLVTKKVDLIFQGHDHNYQRSVQFAHSSGCTSVTPGSYNANCVADNGQDNQYSKGSGSIVVINGNMGRCCYNISASDTEYPYFVKAVGSSTVMTSGITKFVVTSNRIDASVIATTGNYSDSFSIVSQSPTPTPTTTPFSLRQLITSWLGNLLAYDINSDGKINAIDFVFALFR